MNKFLSGFLWTLGRHAATDAYRRPNVFLGMVVGLFKIILIVCFYMLVFGGALFGLVYCAANMFPPS